MKHRWIALGTGLGLAFGVIAGPTLRADDSGAETTPVERAAPVVRTGISGSDTRFVEIEPVRAFDSRRDAYAASGIFDRNTSRTVNVSDGHDPAGTVTTVDAVPAGATAIAYNLTVTGPTGPNYLAVTPGGATSFTVSAINFNGTADVANAGIVAVDSGRNVKVWNGDQSGSTHVIIDITGYFVKPMFAQVDSSGGSTNTSRVVTVTRPAPGLFTVTFDRDVTTCAVVATILDDAASTQSSGLIGVEVDGAIVKVRTRAPDGHPPPDLSSRPFYVEVDC